MKKIVYSLFVVVALSSTVKGATWNEWAPAVGGNGHFYAVTDSSLNWYDARTEAESLGGYLVSIGSAEELDFVRTTFGRKELFWTGLSSTIAQSGIQLPSFQWSNGDPLTYTYFGWQNPDAAIPSSVIINQINGRGFTRGFFAAIDPTSIELRGIVERNADPNPPNNPGGTPVPDAGSPLVLMALAGAAGWLVRRFKR